MNKEELKTIIIDQRETIETKFHSDNVIDREGTEGCKKYIAYPNILLVSGMRRAGKSYFSHLLIRGKNYPYLNFDDERLFGFNAQGLTQALEVFHEMYPNFEFMILDEIQNIPGWELFVSRLRDQYKLIITGSNANLLSSELATHLTGRFVAFTLFPLSFREFLKFNSYKVPQDSSFSTKTKSKIHTFFVKYLKEGGIFDYYKFGAEFSRGLFSSVITKDIVARYKLKYPHILEELALLLINNFASKISVSNLARTLKVKSSHTIKEYITYLENTFLFFSINKFSYKIKEQISAFKKIYAMDNGLANSMIADFSQNRGRFLENLVAIELKRRGLLENFTLYYWDNYHVECDFIIKKGLKIVQAYQVCAELNLRNRDREISGLTGALKEFQLKQGIILSEEQEEEIAIDGYLIKVIPTWKWLLTSET